jgi:hypothetical protein
MGQKLIEYYKLISDEMGLHGKMKLAQETKIPSSMAATMPDSQENLLLFRNSISKLTGKPVPML